jgi:hypothetical protein
MFGIDLTQLIVCVKISTQCTMLRYLIVGIPIQLSRDTTKRISIWVCLYLISIWY